MGVFYIGGREGRCGVFRRLCVGMILGWYFYLSKRPINILLHIMTIFVTLSLITLTLASGGGESDLPGCCSPFSLVLHWSVP